MLPPHATSTCIMNMKTITISALALLISNCGNSDHMPVSDHSKAGILDRQATPGTVTYRATIYPIFQKNCAACHGNGSALGNWLDYSSAYNKRARIFQRITVDRTMPMAPFDKIITERERSLIGLWVTNGAPEGDATPATPTPEPTSIPTPTPTGSPAPAPAPLTYRAGIRQILQKNCMLCHGKESKLGNWMDYQTAYAKREIIYQHVIVDRKMPMAPYDKIITEAERTKIGDWVKAGAPEGEAVTPTPTPASTPHSVENTSLDENLVQDFKENE